MTNEMIIGIIFSSVFLLFFVLVIAISIRNHIYRKFVLEHCDSIKTLKEINAKYKFTEIENLDMEHSYDNEKMYENISCRDYLIYQLKFIKGKVERCLDYSYDNNKVFKRYEKEIIDTCVFEKYDTDELLKNREKLKKTEEEEFKKIYLRPVINYTIEVNLKLVDMGGHRKDRKTDIFDSEQLEDLIADLNDRRGSFYNKEYIWNAICRVERGKVSNKMRFAIYDRDHYRCRICGRKTNDLEIDHIIPISKGGKSTYNNLQTLCHRCNVRKGNTIY